MPSCCTAYATDSTEGDIHAKLDFRRQLVTLCLVVHIAEPMTVEPFGNVLPIQKSVLLCCRGNVRCQHRALHLWFCAVEPCQSQLSQLCTIKRLLCCAAEVMSVTPFKATGIPRSISDASMGLNEDDMVDSPPTRGMPDVRALADALEPPPDMASLKVW